MMQTKYKRWLTLVWFSFAGFMFLLMVMYTVQGRPFGEHSGEVWSWLLPNLMPTLTLIVSVLVIEAHQAPSAAEPAASAFLFGLALALSISYLLSVLAVLAVAGPVLGKDPMPIIKGSGVWLGPMQGLVSGALGAFFIKKG